MPTALTNAIALRRAEAALSGKALLQQTLSVVSFQGCSGKRERCHTLLKIFGKEKVEGPLEREISIEGPRQKKEGMWAATRVKALGVNP